MGILVPIILFLVFAYIVRVLSDNKVRSLIIQKGEINENLQYIMGRSFDYSLPASLKWGMVLMAIGLGLGCGRILDLLGIGSEEFTFAFMFLFGGMAMIVYYFIATKLGKKTGQK